MTEQHASSVSVDRTQLIKRIVDNHTKLYFAGVVTKRVTADGFVFTSEESLLVLEQRQIAALRKHGLDID